VEPTHHHLLVIRRRRLAQLRRSSIGWVFERSQRQATIFFGSLLARHRNLLGM